MAITWNEAASDRLKRLNTIKNPTKAQLAEIASLKAAKANKGKTAAGTPPPAPPPAATPPPVSAPPPLTDGIDTSKVSPTDEEVIKRALGIVDVGEQFGRKIGNEFYSDGALGRVQETNTPEEIAALEQAKRFASTVGIQTDQVRNLLGTQRNILDEARQLSPLELEALGIARNALPGLDAPEMEALRSAARQNIAGAQQASLRDLAKSQARNQVFGSAATAQRNLLGQAGIREGRNLERDLLVKNIEIKQAAQNAFTGLTTNTEANRASRTNAASGQLAQSTLTDEGQRNTAQGNAIANQGTIAGSLAQRLQQLQEFNLGQKAAEKAGQVGSIFSGIGSITGQRGLLAGENFADKQYSESVEASKRIEELLKEAIRKGGL